MNEATQRAIEQPATGLKLYPLDQTEIEVSILSRGQALGHKLTRPTLAQLVEREAQSTYETESVSDSEEKISADDERANARLYDQIVTAIRGYKLTKADTHPLSEWRATTPEIIATIPTAHKATAIRGLYQFSSEVEKDEEEGFTLGADTWTIKQVFGNPDDPDYVVRHVLRTPTEAERREFKRKASDVRFSKGARKLKTKVVTHLKAHVELYDALSDGLGGTSLDSGEVTATDYKALVDPIWKRQVIDCLMRSFEAGLSD